MTVGSTIGEAFVEIRPELSKLFRETNEGVSKAVDDAAKKQQSSFNKVSKVGEAAFVGLTTAAVGFGAVAIKAALEGEKAHALLAAAVKAAGGSMEELEPKVDALSSKFAKLGFVNDEVEAGLARLTQITQSPTRAIELMGVTADLARARHIGLEQAATLVGRAAEGNVTALKRMGIEIQTTGDKAKDGEAAIAELQKRFGGAAQAEAGTYAGKLAAFRAEVSNLEEKIGGALLPKLAGLASGLAGTADYFEHNKTAATLLGVAIGGPLTVAISAYLVKQGIMVGTKVVEFFAALSAEVRLTATELAAAGVGFDAVLGPVGLLVVGVGLLTSQLNASASAHQKAAHAAADAYSKGYLDSIAGASNRTELLKQKIIELNQQGYAGGKIETKANAEAHEKLAKTLNDELASANAAKEAQDDLAKHTGPASDAAKSMGDQLSITSDQADKLAKKLGIDLSAATDDQVKQLSDLNDRLKVTSPATLKLDDALAKLRDTTVDATEKASAFDTALELLVGGNVDSQKAVVNFENAIDGLGAKLKANAASFDVHTKAGRDDITMVEDAVTGIRSHIEAMEAQGFTADQIKQAFAGDTEELRKQLEQTGLTKAQVDKLLASYGLLPSSINTIVTAETTEAQKAWNDLMAAAQPYLNALAKLPAAEIKGAASTVTVPHFAGGGWVPGPAGQAIPAVVHAGEFVLSRDMLRSLTKPAQTGAAPIPVAGGPAVHIEHLTVQGATTAGAFATARELVRAQIAEVYRRTGVS